jgi:hypothetical protein
MHRNVKNLAPRAVLLALALALVATAPAAAQTPLSPVEGTWTFLGGRIAVERQEDGSFLGTIIRRTNVDVCPGEIGERIWIDLRLQDDGQYWGEHQFFRTSECEVVPERGNAAFRVINRAGVTFLRICLADPEGPDAQPSIAEDGTETNATGGCHDAEFFDLLPTAEPKLKKIVKLPRQSGGCVPKKRFLARLRHPRGDALTEAKVKLDGRKRTVRRKGTRLRARIVASEGTHRLRVVAETARGRVIKGTRRFTVCA